MWPSWAPSRCDCLADTYMHTCSRILCVAVLLHGHQAGATAFFIDTCWQVALCTCACTLASRSFVSRAPVWAPSRCTHLTDTCWQGRQPYARFACMLASRLQPGSRHWALGCGLACGCTPRSRHVLPHSSLALQQSALCYHAWFDKRECMHDYSLLCEHSLDKLHLHPSVCCVRRVTSALTLRSATRRCGLSRSWQAQHQRCARSVCVGGGSASGVASSAARGAIAAAPECTCTLDHVSFHHPQYQQCT
jgi:hypothetical protein